MLQALGILFYMSYMRYAKFGYDLTNFSCPKGKINEKWDELSPCRRLVNKLSEIQVSREDSKC